MPTTNRNLGRQAEKIVNGECSPDEQSAQKDGDEVKAGSSGEAAEAGGSASSSGSAGAGDEQPQSGRRSRRNWKPYMALVADQDAPGYDSGCTAVVGLVRGRHLVVANAGDSRCVVCRSGQALDMSLDHKPEDAAEYNRIRNAGGRVTKEGRVNGGLNLSRAIGDHAYKRNKDLELRDQMITALPDVKALDIDPATDEFMVLACDGIWNNMTSQEVVDFVKRELDKGTRPLSAICEMLFDACLAPDTTGDGTGCDNMTCIIVQFHQDKDDDRVANGNKGQKRSLPADGEPSEGTEESEKDTVEETPSKRCRMDDSATASDVEATPNGAKATEVTDV
ncbi:hypothetical protein MTO96_012217 [Rhipicephalus appendiculatus]